MSRKPITHRSNPDRFRELKNKSKLALYEVIKTIIMLNDWTSPEKAVGWDEIQRELEKLVMSSYQVQELFIEKSRAYRHYASQIDADPSMPQRKFWLPDPHGLEAQRVVATLAAMKRMYPYNNKDVRKEIGEIISQSNFPGGGRKRSRRSSRGRRQSGRRQSGRRRSSNRVRR